MRRLDTYIFLVSLTQLIRIMHNIYKVRGSNLGHPQERHLHMKHVYISFLLSYLESLIVFVMDQNDSRLI